VEEISRKFAYLCKQVGEYDEYAQNVILSPRTSVPNLSSASELRSAIAINVNNLLDTDDIPATVPLQAVGSSASAAAANATSFDAWVMGALAEMGPDIAEVIDRETSVDTANGLRLDQAVSQSARDMWKKLGQMADYVGMVDMSKIGDWFEQGVNFFDMLLSDGNISDAVGPIIGWGRITSLLTWQTVGSDPAVLPTGDGTSMLVAALPAASGDFGATESSIIVRQDMPAVAAAVVTVLPIAVPAGTCRFKVRGNISSNVALTIIRDTPVTAQLVCVYTYTSNGNNVTENQVENVPVVNGIVVAKRLIVAGAGALGVSSKLFEMEIRTNFLVPTNVELRIRFGDNTWTDAGAYYVSATMQMQSSNGTVIVNPGTLIGISTENVQNTWSEIATNTHVQGMIGANDIKRFILSAEGFGPVLTVLTALFAMYQNNIIQKYTALGVPNLTVAKYANPLNWIGFAVQPASGFSGRARNEWLKLIRNLRNDYCSFFLAYASDSTARRQISSTLGK
jgi:hypothetical protein